ncbi:Constitutive coactivator of PPAR-gamma-like protein 1 [Liparis tanakae]|uniref:Constitutive coactivator of PPAR-gamma-like protein 1 n=1 Tax=Liparis tanakae TaxID=230148 RepID=A0A4Z2IR28_9TELE|nr:Constitutive coactivator of PPAR-gamma-like protein 1 [Liparis tanakae]
MGVQGLQEYIEKHCPSAVVPVELQKLARGSIVGGGQQRPPHSPLRLLVDAENCLHRLYGGFYTDWVSGGQWNHMLGYLAALSKACFHGNIELLVCFNGALEKGRLHEWVKRQVNERQTAQQIISHVQNKGTPPPKVWFLPPVCMAHCIRLALLRFRVGVIQSVEDHHLEVIAMCREGGFHGLVAYDSDYALCNIPCYFSAHALKLSRNGKSLTTTQYLMHEVRAHQLVLPPCDVVIKAVADYVRNIPDVGNLDAVGKDIFKHSQTCTDDKVLRFKKAVGYYSVASSPAHLPPQSVRPKPTGAPAARPFPKTLDIPHEPLPIKPTGVQLSYPAADPAGKDPPQRNGFAGVTGVTGEGKHTSLHVGDLKGGWEKNGCAPHSENRPTGDPGERTKADLCVTPAAIPGSQAQGLGGLRAQIPSLLSMPTRNHMDVTIPALPAVAPEVLRVAEHRHQKGLMYPYIYHTLTKGEIKLSVTIEDEANKDLPSAVQLFRPIRQCVYGVLFSLAEARKKAERVAMRKNCLPEYTHVIVKEWAAYKGKSPHTPELVEALSFREWTCPNLKKLWLGKAVEDKNRRMRAFLACMRSDTPGMLNPASVPTPLLVLCCVLRFMLHWPGVRILRRNELDAFLAQALSPKLYEPDQLQELKSKPAPKPAHTAVNKPALTAEHDAAKETKKPGPDEKKTSPTTENGVEDDGEAVRLNGEEEERGALIQPDSAFSNDYKTSFSNPHLNALNEDGGGRGEEGLEAAVLNTEE